ncbi:AimR family lysis-lysogeny pheromone receptor [Jeotgalibacillus marinus]|uniref:AimR family lysis-lysogeny pheromone receptor n=1 Tax=Jeotgalibacillus marinus TaxID=86667 RepID=A0ABV3Q8J4_9BACL
MDTRFGVTLKELLKKRGIKQKDLSEKCGVSTSLLNKVINHDRESHFEIILTLVQTIIDFDKQLQEKELMDSYVHKIRNSSNIKMAMEYCDTRDMRETLKMLCERADSKANHKNNLKEYSTMYKLNMERRNQESELNDNVSMELFQKIMCQNNKTEEMQIFQSIIEILLFNQEIKYLKLIDLIPKLETKFEKIEKESYVNKSLKMRFNQLQQVTYLRNICDFKKVRELAYEALDHSMGRRFDAARVVHIGESYIHQEDPTDAIKYLTKSIEIYKELGLDFAADWMLEKIEFIGILRGRKFDFVKHDSNIALNYILDGQKEVGLKILDNLDTTPKTLYIKGVATDDASYFWKSLEGYMRRGDRLYGLFSVQELKRLGEREEAVDMLYNNISKEVTRSLI